MKLQKLLTTTLATIMAISLAQSVFADDIEVYGVNSSGGSRPNVLFIVDTSGSMARGTDGEVPEPGEDSKLKILKNVFEEVLSSSTGKINAGLLHFNSDTGGIKWPIAGLNTDASTIDSEVTSGLSSQDVMLSIVNRVEPKGETNYVNALIEARRYFQGGAVWYNGWAEPQYGDTRKLPPPYWDNDHYTDAHFDADLAANKSSYIPQDAFKWRSNAPEPTVYQCWDGSIGGEGNSNQCEGLELVPNGCTYHQASDYKERRCQAWSCDSWDADGDCNGYTCSGGWKDVNVHSSAYQWCDYYFGGWESANYVSPIGTACQDNFIVLLSDGLPSNNYLIWKAKQILGETGVDSCENMGPMLFNDSSNDSGNCAPELIEDMAYNDLVAAIPGSTVKTYTIGFGLLGEEAARGKQYLEYLAQKGGGEFFAADSYETLVTSLNSVISSIAGESDDFTGISVGFRNSSFSNDDRAFINVFKPSTKRAWRGNMKGYFLSGDGLLDIHGNKVIDTDGSINKNTQSFWSANEDGVSVSKGGLVETIRTSSRNLYTYTGSDAPNNVTLTAPENALSTDNLALSNSMLGVTDQAARDEILSWVATAGVSDPLHSKPTIAKYSTGEVLFTMTNQGFIHAVDASSPTVLEDETGGEELYAFIPQELLINLGQIKTNLSTGSHIYGLDGQITLHHEDANEDGIINSNEVARLYFGMRRGGQHYYALDISNRRSPRLLWQIKGGEGDFSAMGQSWSRMSLTTLKSGTDKKALIFGGGYDPMEDGKTTRSSGKGNRVYVVDAATGDLMWSVGAGAAEFNAPTMIYSIPTDIAVIDINGNGYTDHLYFGDMGGQLWRVKFAETLDSNDAPENNFDSNVTVKRIGDFGVSANRKFFYPPAVALMSQAGKPYLAITIGSGNRAHPLNNAVRDMIFMLRDTLDTPIASTLKLHDLYDATDNLVAEGPERSAERASMNAADGWYIKLRSSEKSLSKMVVYDEKLRFTTYEPSEIVTQACSASSNSNGKYYVMSLADATPSSDGHVDVSTLTKEDRGQSIATQGIASEPNIVFLPDNTVEVFVGKENISTVTQSIKQIFWKQIR